MARRMWLSVLAAQKSCSRLLPQNSFHGDPHVPGGGPRGAPGRASGGAFDLSRGGPSQAEFTGWDSRFRAGLGEETPQWGRDGGARQSRMVQETAAMLFRHPGSNPPLFANPRAGGTWWARAAAARGKLAMGRLRERAAAESGGGGAQSAAGRESGRRGAGCGLPPPGAACQGEAHTTTQPLQHHWRRSLHPSGPCPYSVGKTEALVPATQAGARQYVPPESAFPTASTSRTSLLIKQPLDERPGNAPLLRRRQPKGNKYIHIKADFFWSTNRKRAVSPSPPPPLAPRGIRSPVWAVVHGLLSATKPHVQTGEICNSGVLRDYQAHSSLRAVSAQRPRCNFDSPSHHFRAK